MRSSFHRLHGRLPSWATGDRILLNADELQLPQHRRMQFIGWIREHDADFYFARIRVNGFADRRKLAGECIARKRNIMQIRALYRLLCSLLGPPECPQLPISYPVVIAQVRWGRFRQRVSVRRYPRGSLAASRSPAPRSAGRSRQRFRAHTGLFPAARQGTNVRDSPEP